MPQKYPSNGGEAVELTIDPAGLHDAFAADLSAEQAAVLAATQRPVAQLAFTETNGPPAWRRLPSWAIVASGDKAAGADVTRSMAERAGATITELDGLARDHGLPAAGGDRRDPRGRRRGRRAGGAGRSLT